MSQFAVYETRDDDVHLCRIQSELGLETPAILCAPVVTRENWGIIVPRLHIPVSVKTQTYVIVMSQMQTVEAWEFGRELFDVAEYRDQIVAAIDHLVIGF